MRAPAISSCAEKIFVVERVERMRRRSARRLAATSGAPLDLAALLAALGRVHGLGLVLVDPQRPALGRLELAVELLDRALQALDGVVPEGPALPDPVEDAAVVACDVVEELALEATDVRHRHLVQLAGGAQPDRDDLALHRVGLVLALLEQLDQTLAALERGPAGGVEVGGERGEGLELAVLGQVQPQPEIGRAHVGTPVTL